MRIKFKIIFIGIAFILLGCQSSEDTSIQEPKDRIAVQDGSNQTITTKFNSVSYLPITVKANIPVKWTIVMDEEDITGCNRQLRIPEYDITIDLQPGDNIVEFTPTATGSFPYSCWMGMIQSEITVTD